MSNDQVSSRRFLQMLAVSCLICASPLAAADGWGDLKGRFVYDGDPPAAEPAVQGQPIDESLVVDPDSHGIANIVVWVLTERVAVHPNFAVPAIKQADWQWRSFQFDPHVVSLRTGQKLVVKNNDSEGHILRAQGEHDPQFSAVSPPGTAQGDSKERTFKKQETFPIKVTCDIHAWERGWLIVRDNPYVAVTAADGSFELNKLPAVELEFQFWHERAGWLKAKPDWAKGRMKLKVVADETTDMGEVRIDPALFKLAK